LKERLAAAQAAAAEAQATIAAKDADIKKNANVSREHDLNDHKTIDRLAAQLQYEQASKTELQKNFNEQSDTLVETEARLQVAADKVISFTVRITIVEAELEVERKDGRKLKTENKEMSENISQLEKKIEGLQRQLQHDKRSQDELVESLSKEISKLANKSMNTRRRLARRRLRFSHWRKSFGVRRVSSRITSTKSTNPRMMSRRPNFDSGAISGASNRAVRTSSLI